MCIRDSYYLAVLLEAGELTIACRRLLVTAYEDIGLANPAATLRTVSAVQAAERLGMPEARIPLAFAVTELALSPKSNTSYMGINKAMGAIRDGKVGPIPLHLRDAHYSGAKDLGHGVDYLYPHDYPHHYVTQQYLPDVLVNEQFFNPDTSNKYESTLSQIYQQLKQDKKS